MNIPRPRRATRRWTAIVCACVLAAAVLLAPVSATAQEEEIKKDGRMEGYAERVSVDNDSTALMWLLFIVVGVVAFSVMFKNAKRSHLD